MLIAAGRWRVFTAATATALSLAAVTVALFGAQVWVDFVKVGMPAQNLVLADPQFVATPFYPTVFMNVRGLGASYAQAMTVQLCFSACAAAAVGWAFRLRGRADSQHLMALFLTCSVAATPYLLAYDTLATCFAALMLLDSSKLDAPGRRSAQLVYWLPIIQLGLGAAHVPGPALIPPIFAIYLLMRIKSSTTAAEALA